MFAIRKRLDARVGSPPNTRVNPDTGDVETTVDGGATWQPNPYGDPRINPVYMKPPPDVPDVQCAAAAGMVENVRRVIDGAAGGGTVAGIATVLLTLLLIPGIGWMFAAMLLFASSFVAAGSAAVLAAFTEDVYDRLLCVFFENIDADGRVSWSQLEAVQSTMAGEFPDPLVGDVLAGIFQMHKEVGFTNAGVAYADPEADCECAPEWCRSWNFAETDGSADGWYAIYGSYSPGVGWVGAPDGFGSSYVIYLENDTAIPQFSNFVVTYIKNQGAGLNNNNSMQVYDATGLIAVNNTNNLADEPLSKLIDDDHDNVTTLVAQINAGTGAVDAVVTIISISVRGYGENPFGEDNCE
jgi:hypothetical protein